MTGYARHRRQTSLGELTVSLRSVNHRGLDLHFHHGQEFAPFENQIRGLLKQHIVRGHLEVRTQLTRDRASVPGFKRDGVAHYVAAFRQAAHEFGLSGEPDLNAALRLPGVLEEDGSSDAIEDSFAAEIVAAFSDCAAEFNGSREREGAVLREQALAEAAAIAAAAEKMTAIRQSALVFFRQRLDERLRELLDGASIAPYRLAEEAALLADRSDIQEELTRLTIHTGELCRILVAGGEVGKRLDFLLQEMNRETNTILSKTSGVGDVGLTLTGLALAAKASIEKIREQSLNLE
jgi:uncharacterized protein (TIGR00255 family)